MVKKSIAEKIYYNMPKLSIIVPACNEEERVERTLLQYIYFFSKKMPSQYEIIVIPNHCHDRTVEIVSRLSWKYPFLLFKEFSEKIGKSGALIEGFKLAKGGLIGFTDADNSGPPESFYKLVRELQDFDGAIGSRWLPESEIKIKQPFLRRLFSRSFNFLVRFLLRLKFYDTQCGLKVFKKEALHEIIPLLGKTQWAFDIDLLYKLKRNNKKIIEIPIKWDDDPRTRLNLKNAPIRMFLSLIRLRLMYSPFKFIILIYDRLPESLKIHH